MSRDPPARGSTETNDDPSGARSKSQVSAALVDRLAVVNDLHRAVAKRTQCRDGRPVRTFAHRYVHVAQGSVGKRKISAEDERRSRRRRRTRSPVPTGEPGPPRFVVRRLSRARDRSPVGRRLPAAAVRTKAHPTWEAALPARPRSPHSHRSRSTSNAGELVAATGTSGTRHRCLRRTTRPQWRPPATIRPMRPAAMFAALSPLSPTSARRIHGGRHYPMIVVYLWTLHGRQKKGLDPLAASGPTVGSSARWRALMRSEACTR